MPDVIEDILQSQESRQGYVAWVMQRSGVAVHSTLDSIAETLTATGEARIGYAAWILTPSGLNVPSIDEVIVGVPEFEDTVTCIGINVPSLDETIIGTPVVPTPEPVPVSPGVGGGTYAPLFEQDRHFVDIEETLDNVHASYVALVEYATVEDEVTVYSVNKSNVWGKYRKPIFVAYPTLPEIDIPPKVVEVVPKFPDETPFGMFEERRQKQLKQLLLLDLI